MAQDQAKDEAALADEAAQRIRELNERVIEAARQGGTAYLDAYEQALLSILGYQQQVAAATPFEWVQRIVDAQASFTREVVKLSASTARQFMR